MCNSYCHSRDYFFYQYVTFMHLKCEWGPLWVLWHMLPPHSQWCLDAHCHSAATQQVMSGCSLPQCIHTASDVWMLAATVQPHRNWCLDAHCNSAATQQVWKRGNVNFFPMGVNFYLMNQIFLHIGFNCKIKFLPQPEFSLAMQIFTLQAPIFTVITEVWPCANWAMVTSN